MGDAVRAEVTAPVEWNGRLLIPRHAIVTGHVAKVNRVGRGLVRERASIQLAFTGWEHPSGGRHPLTARLRSVDNAREQVNSKGRIQGVLMAGGPPGFMLGLWRRPEISMFGRSGVGLVGVQGFVAGQMNFNPLVTAGVLATRLIMIPGPDPEIHYRPGAEIVLSLDVALSNAPSELLPPVVAPDDGLRSLVARQPFRLSTLKGKPADLTNVLFRGSRVQLIDAFSSAGWYPAEPLTRRSALRVYQAYLRQKAYPTAPMSPLVLEDRPPDLSFQKSLNTAVRRHHLRIWRQPDHEDREVWLAAATHDIGYSLKRRGIAHTIDPRIDLERRKVVEDLAFAGCLQGAHVVERSAPPVNKVVTDGRMAVVDLRDCHHRAVAPESAPFERMQMKRINRLLRRLVLDSRHAATRGNVYYWGYRTVRHLARRKQSEPRPSY